MLNGNPPLGDLDFPRKSVTFCHFSNQTIWLALALKALFWRVTGTIVGTVLRAFVPSARTALECGRSTSARLLDDALQPYVATDLMVEVVQKQQ